MAGQIIAAAAVDLAELVDSVKCQIEVAEDSFPLAISGGVLIGRADLRTLLGEELDRRKLQPEMHVISEPVLGAVKIAALQLIDQ